MGNFVDMGTRLREERERLDYSQSAFAALAGAGRKTQFNYEIGERSPDGAYLAAIAEAGADVQYILTGEHAATVLEPEERVLIQSFRRSPVELRKAALRILIAEEVHASRSSTIHGDVNQNIGGDASFAGAVTFNVAGSQKHPPQGSGRGKTKRERGNPKE